MNAIVIYVIIAAAMFSIAFITKRRVGLLGLALAAGSLMSTIWGNDLGSMVNSFGAPSSAFTSALVHSAIILLPAFFLLFRGSTYKTLFGRIVGAGSFTILALAFLIVPLSRVLTPVVIGADVYNLLVNNRTLLIGIGLIISVVDLLLTSPAGSPDKKH